MFDENDYLSSDILNDIENKIVQLYSKYSSYLNRNYTKKNWTNGELVYVDDIKNIEDAIDYLGYCFGYPDEFVTSRNWKLDAENNISYKDLNRWINNINFLIEQDFNPLLPKSNLYPNDNLYPTNRKESD